MFREIREVKGAERTYKDRKEEGYKKIKPEKEYTMEELDLYWQEIFRSIQES